MPRRMSADRTSRDDIGTPRNLEGEHVLGQTGVFAIVGELEGRTAALQVRRSQHANLQRDLVRGDDQPVVITLLLPRVEAERYGVVIRRVGIADIEIAQQVALTG